MTVHLVYAAEPEEIGARMICAAETGAAVLHRPATCRCKAMPTMRLGPDACAEPCGLKGRRPRSARRARKARRPRLRPERSETKSEAVDSATTGLSTVT